MLEKSANSKKNVNHMESIKRKCGVDLGEYGVTEVYPDKESETVGSNRYKRYLLTDDGAEMHLGGYYFEFEDADKAYECVLKLRENGVVMPPDELEEARDAFLEEYPMDTLPKEVLYIATKKTHEELGQWFKERAVYRERGYFTMGEFVVCTPTEDVVEHCISGIMAQITAAKKKQPDV